MSNNELNKQNLKNYQQVFALTAAEKQANTVIYNYNPLSAQIEIYIDGRRSDNVDIFNFPDFTFDLALCSHYLFRSIEEQNLDFQTQTIADFARIAKEVRIYPLTDKNGEPSAFLGPVLLDLQKNNFGVEINGDAILRVWALQCTL